MKKEGYVIVRSKNLKEFFTASSSYDRPQWTQVSEATIYLSPESAEKAASKLHKYGAYSAKVIPLNEYQNTDQYSNQDQQQITLHLSQQNQHEDEEHSSQDPEEQGYNDFFQEVPKEKNPHQPYTTEYNLWNQGWDSAEDHNMKHAEPHDSIDHHEDEERSSFSPKFTKGQNVHWNGRDYIVVVPDAHADFVGISPDGSVENVKMVRQNEIKQNTEDNEECEEKAMSRSRFMKSDRVLHNGKPHTVIQDAGTGNVVIQSDEQGSSPTTVNTATLSKMSESFYSSVNTQTTRQGVGRSGEQEWVVDASQESKVKKSLPQGAKIQVSRDGTRWIIMPSGKMMRYDNYLAQNTHLKEALSTHFGGNNPATPDENDATPPHLKTPKVSQVDFKDPVGTEDKPKTDLNYSGSYQHGDKVEVPQEVKTSLKNAMAIFKNCADFNNTRDDYKASFCMTVHDAMAELYDYLEDGTVEAIKMAQIKLTSMMNPITSNIPENVRDFIYRGGRKPSLKDLFDLKRGEKTLDQVSQGMFNTKD